MARWSTTDPDVVTDRRRVALHSQHFRSDVLFSIAVLLAVYVAYRAIDVLMLVYVAALFAVVLAPAIGLVRRARFGDWRPGRGLAIVVILVTVLTALVLFLVFAIPPISRDAHALAENWPMKVNDLTARIRKVPFLEDFNAGKLQEYGAGFAGGALGVARGLAGGVFGLFYWAILTAYFIMDGERAFHWGLSMFPRNHRERLERTLLRAENRMRHWLVGQLALMLILGTSSAIVFGLLDLKYFYAIAVFTGLCNIVPIVGPLVAVVVAGMVALVDSPTKMLGVIGFFALYQQIETAFLTPRIMKSTVDLPALAVIIALSLGGALAGVQGALVAVPTAALCAVLIDEYLVRKDTDAGEDQTGLL